MDLSSQPFHLLGNIALVILGYQFVTKFLPWIYVNVLAPKFIGPKVDVRRMGDWAVVTGATDGIGKSYAKLLAKQGLNIVLISRSLEKLQAVAKEIRDQHKVDVKVVEVDFTDGVEIYEKIRLQLEGLDVGVLVNNVGISYMHPDFFVDVATKNPQFMRDIVTANIHSVTHMCAMLMPRMLAKKKGVIINLSSTAAVIPNPLLTIYSATKAFVDKFSVDLQTEYRSQGIIVQSVQPGFVATNMTKIRKASCFAPSPDVYVEAALNRLGYNVQTAGYLPHSLLQVTIAFMSSLICEPFVQNVVFKNLLSTRHRASRNAAKKQ